MKNLQKDYILILDFGSQYTKILSKRIQEFGVHCEIQSWNISESQLNKNYPKGIILSGSPESIIKKNKIISSKTIFEKNIPILGICYGMHVMALQFGGKIKKFKKGEFGSTKLKILKNIQFIENIYDYKDKDNIPILEVWMSHKDQISHMPKDFVNVASTKNCPFAMIVNKKKNFFGTQFHPEVTHTAQGKRILERFILKICQCSPVWKSKNIVENLVSKIREKVKKDKVILGFSGGVDSSVMAVLLYKSIGIQLTCIFINNGLLRNQEIEKVEYFFKKYHYINFIKIEAGDIFLKSLSNIKNPESKRKIIGQLFIKIFNKQARKMKDVKWLAQGTIYPDIIESSSIPDKRKYVIKSHHNVGGLPKNMKLKLLEPLKGLFKDEVKKIGKILDLPNEIILQHPFPGPGLSIRILGIVKKRYCEILRHADSIFIEELKKSNLYSKISQAFAVFIPIKSVGVVGDNRKYGWTIALRAIQTIDFMTAKWTYLPMDLIDSVSKRIVNEIKEISRVVYDVSGKPPATIEWE